MPGVAVVLVTNAKRSARTKHSINALLPLLKIVQLVKKKIVKKKASLEKVNQKYI